MFRDREDAGRQLAARLKNRDLYFPLVLAIPRGGVITGAVLARELGADLDVVLSRKLHAAENPEFALGAVAEDGHVYLNPDVGDYFDVSDEYIARQREHQLAEIARRQWLFRDMRPHAPVADRSVIITDDGIATGSTMIAALQTVRAQKPRELIVAVPVAPPRRLREIGRWCDEVICLYEPEAFWAIGEFYEDFTQVSDQRVVEILRHFAPAPCAAAK